MTAVELTEQDMRLARETIESVNRKRARNGRGSVDLMPGEPQIIAKAIADAREEGWRARSDRVGQIPKAEEGR